jgi:perosamine synthetase
VTTPASVPISRPEFGTAEEQAVVEVMRSGQIAMGPKTAEFENAWAAYCGVKHAVMMANGTVAMEALLRGLGIGLGDEVITVSFSFNATVSTILQVGASPVFVDVRDHDFCIDPSQVAAAVTPRTKAIMPVHLYGQMADMEPLERIARQHGLVIIEDAAQAHGASYQGRKAGSFGPAMFSLYATKNVAVGEGGVITTDDDRLADWLRVYRNHGMRVRYYHDALGTNFKPTDLAAAIGLAQLATLDDRNERRRANAARLTNELRGCVVPSVGEGRTHVWHQYTVRVAERRDAVRDALAARGVGANVYYPVPIHRQAYVDSRTELANAYLPMTDRLSADVLSLPVRANLLADELDHVITTANEVVASVGARR